MLWGPARNEWTYHHNHAVKCWPISIHVDSQNLGASWVWSQTGPSTHRAGRDWRKRRPLQAGRWVAGSISQGTYIQGLSWVATRRVICAPIHQMLKVYVEALTEFIHIPSPESFNVISSSQGCILGTASGSRQGKQNTHSKDIGGRKEPLSTQVHLVGQLTVMSSWWPPPTI